jgi:hypothetical protein
LRLHTVRGVTIVAAGGTLDMSDAAWLGERMLAPARILQEGEAHVVQDAGWIAIAARDDAEFVCLPPQERASPLQRLLAPLAFLTRRLRAGA